MAEEKIDNSQKSSYRGILKATSLFGGVQVYQILIEIIKSKFIAVLLGPTGVGVQGLYTSATQMVQQMTSFGLAQSAVRNVAEANGTGDHDKISKTVTTLRRLVWLTGFLGMIAFIIFSPFLSQTSFGDSIHIWGFIIVSVILLLNEINAGQRVILQGTRKFKYLAKCTAYGVTIGLLVSVPLYYLYGVDAIVPNILISSITTLVLSWYFSSKVSIKSTNLTWKETFTLGKSMLVMGLAMSMTQVLTYGSSYILRSCIRLWGGIEAVGLFTAGFALMSQYTGLVFQAMGTDFYPRLAAVNKDNKKCREIMNQQGEIGIILIGPLMVLCIVFIPFVIRILYSKSFLAVTDYVVWCAVGVIFQMASWAVSYIFIAKAESKLFITNEVISSIYGLAFNLLGYYYGGLTGLGMSFTLKYLVYFIQVYIITRTKYEFSFTKSFLMIFTIQVVLVLLCVCVTGMLPKLYHYILGVPLLLLLSYYSYSELNRRIDFVGLVKSRLKKKYG